LSASSTTVRPNFQSQTPAGMQLLKEFSREPPKKQSGLFPAGQTRRPGAGRSADHPVTLPEKTSVGGRFPAEDVIRAGGEGHRTVRSLIPRTFRAAAALRRASVGRAPPADAARRPDALKKTAAAYPRRLAGLPLPQVEPGASWGTALGEFAFGISGRVALAALSERRRGAEVSGAGLSWADDANANLPRALHGLAGGGGQKGSARTAGRDTRRVQIFERKTRWFSRGSGCSGKGDRGKALLFRINPSIPVELLLKGNSWVGPGEKTFVAKKKKKTTKGPSPSQRRLKRAPRTEKKRAKGKKEMKVKKERKEKRKSRVAGKGKAKKGGGRQGKSKAKAWATEARRCKKKAGQGKSAKKIQRRSRKARRRLFRRLPAN